MFTNNKFAKMDSIANLVKTILEADTKAKMEELKGGQHKIDRNKNNRIDAQDFEILRRQKKGIKKEEVVAEGRMPSSVIRNRKRLTDMPDKEFAELHKNKSDDELRDMAWRHGYGQNSTYYVDKRKSGIKVVAEGGIETPRKNIKKPPAPGTLAHDVASGKFAQFGFTKSGRETAARRRQRMQTTQTTQTTQKEEVDQVDEAKEPTYTPSIGLNRREAPAPKKPGSSIPGRRVQGRGYDSETNVRKAPEGKLATTSLMPGHDQRAAEFLARQVAGTGRVVQGKAQNAPQKEPGVKKEELDPNKSTTDTLKGREKASMNPFLSKKVMMDVPDNVKEETVLDEADELNARRQIVLNKTPKGKEREIARNRDELKFKIKTTRQMGGLAGPKPGQLPEELELDEGSGPKGKQRRPYPGNINSPAARAAAAAQRERMAAADKAEPGKKLLDKIQQRNEELEQIDEVGDTPAGRAALRAVRDRADATKAGYEKRGGITGRTPEERASQRRELSKAARAGVYARNRLHGFGPAGRMKSEEVEQIDESDLGSQFDDFMASRNANRKPGQPKMTPRTAQSVRKPGGPKTPDDALAHMVANIPSGIRQRGLKNEMNERELSGPETAEKERIVKGMKKSLAGFKARYGERAKNVMYATATKKAKENK